MRERHSNLAAISVLLVAAGAISAHAGDGPQGLIAMSATAGTGTPRAIEVHGAGGHYDRVSAPVLQISRQLRAEISAGDPGYRIIASELVVKPGGSVKEVPPTDIHGQSTPSKVAEADGVFDVSFDPLGPVAQNAIRICNASGASGDTLSMTVPVVWRVTAGRFNFKWIDYDQVAPSEDMSRNRDFYVDRVTNEVETAVAVGVTCQPLSALVAAKSSNSAAPEVQTAASAPAVDPAVTRVSATPAEAVTGQPVCKGGFVRQTNASPAAFLCLCPGNTRRTETGANAFACSKVIARR